MRLKNLHTGNTVRYGTEKGLMRGVKGDVATPDSAIQLRLDGDRIAKELQELRRNSPRSHFLARRRNC